MAHHHVQTNQNAAGRDLRGMDGSRRKGVTVVAVTAAQRSASSAGPGWCAAVAYIWLFNETSEIGASLVAATRHSLISLLTVATE